MIYLFLIIPFVLILLIYLLIMADLSARIQKLEKKAARVEQELF